jgi:hypothetical protein
MGCCCFRDTYSHVLSGLVVLPRSTLLVFSDCYVSISHISAIMKAQLTSLTLCGTIAFAAPLDKRAGVSDTATDMVDIVNGKAACAPVAVLFARGTFDSG